MIFFLQTCSLAWLRIFPCLVPFMFSFTFVGICRYVSSTTEDVPKRCLYESTHHVGPKVIDKSAVIHLCLKEPDWIQLICFPLTIFAQADIKHSVRFVVLSLINWWTLFSNQSPAHSTSKRRFGGKSSGFTFFGWPPAISEHHSELQDLWLPKKCFGPVLKSCWSRTTSFIS